MKTSATDHSGSIGHHAQWLRVAAVGLTALLFLAAATGQRNSVVDRSSKEGVRVERQVPPSSIDAMVQEMLTHD